MRIKKAVYCQGAVKREQYPAFKAPEIALLGRSNVGKSSLINCLLGRKGLARTSGEPGKTQLINFYLCDDGWYFVDLPGYGYAKVSFAERERWQKMIAEYLQDERERKLYWQLVDIRHEPSVLDIEMRRRLLAQGIDPLLIATKADKISKGARDQQLHKIAKAMQCPREEIVCFSAAEHLGQEQLLAMIEEFLAARNC